MTESLPSVSAKVMANNVIFLRVAYIAFLILITFKCLVIPPFNKDTNTVIWVLQITPLVIFSYGIFTLRRGHIAGYCYVLLVYFVFIGAFMFVPETRFYTWTSLALIVSSFTSGMMHVRWTRKGVQLIQSEED